jgi:hypothetical protein
MYILFALEAATRFMNFLCWVLYFIGAYSYPFWSCYQVIYGVYFCVRTYRGLLYMKLSSGKFGRMLQGPAQDLSHSSLVLGMTILDTCDVFWCLVAWLFMTLACSLVINSWFKWIFKGNHDWWYLWFSLSVTALDYRLWVLTTELKSCLYHFNSQFLG